MSREENSRTRLRSALDLIQRHGWLFILAVSLGLHALVLLCFAVRWDRAAMVTVVPFSVWCAIGFAIAVVSLLWRRTTPGLAVAALWMLTFLRADEVRAWKNLGTPLPHPSGPQPVVGATERRPLRLVSYNTFLHSLPAAAEVKQWNPDIVLLQESPREHQLRPLAKELFGEQALLAVRPDCAIIARGQALQVFDFQWPVALPGGVPWAICARLNLPDGRPIDILNLHLLPAETSGEFWTRQAWRDHAANRRNRRFQLDLLLSTYQTVTNGLPKAPVIVAGDFNAPARDAALLSLPAAGLRDSYDMAGSRPGNTYPNRFPLQRIDQCWFSPNLLPVRHTTHQGQHSDHRMVIVDFLWP